MAGDRRRDDCGAVFLEYGLIATLIAVVVAVAVGPFGTAVSGLFLGVVGF
jgi:pilus assembly protein Flp/PilA